MTKHAFEGKAKDKLTKLQDNIPFSPGSRARTFEVVLVPLKRLYQDWKSFSSVATPTTQHNTIGVVTVDQTLDISSWLLGGPRFPETQ